MEEVKFKQIQALKHKAYMAFAEGTTLDVPQQDITMMDPISLAFVGDAYYALHMRQRLVDTGIPNVQVLHLLAAEFVSAKAQAYVYRKLKETLDEMEKAICHRARNAYSQVPKSATVAEYHDSTALEALVGYLVLSRQQKKLDNVMLQVYAYTKEYCRIVHGMKE